MDLGMVAPSIDNSAMVQQLLAEAAPSCGSRAEQSVVGGQLTRDLMVSHNESHPNQKVSPGDLLPSLDPDHLCRGSVPLNVDVWLSD